MTSTPSLNERVAGELRVAAARSKFSGANIARAIDETPVWVSRRLSAAVQISVDDLARICGALGVSPVEVLDHALATAPLVAAAP